MTYEKRNVKLIEFFSTQNATDLPITMHDYFKSFLDGCEDIRKAYKERMGYGGSCDGCHIGLQNK